jgi:hypothetical protein
MRRLEQPEELASLRVSPQKMRAPVRFITCLTSGTILLTAGSRPSRVPAFQCQLLEHARSPLLPWTISVGKRFACTTTGLIVFNNRR